MEFMDQKRSLAFLEAVSGLKKSSKQHKKMGTLKTNVTAKSKTWSLPLATRYKMIHTYKVFEPLLDSICYVPNCPWLGLLRKGVHVPLFGPQVESFSQDLCQSWQAAMGHPPVMVNMLKIRACAIHFQEDAFVEYVTETGGIKTRLAPDAVPTKFLGQKSVHDCASKRKHVVDVCGPKLAIPRHCTLKKRTTISDHNYNADFSLQKFEMTAEKLDIAPDEIEVLQKTLEAVHGIYNVYSVLEGDGEKRLDTKETEELARNVSQQIIQVEEEYQQKLRRNALEPKGNASTLTVNRQFSAKDLQEVQQQHISVCVPKQSLKLLNHPKVQQLIKKQVAVTNKMPVVTILDDVHKRQVKMKQSQEEMSHKDALTKVPLKDQGGKRTSEAEKYVAKLKMDIEIASKQVVSWQRKLDFLQEKAIHRRMNEHKFQTSHRTQSGIRKLIVKYEKLATQLQQDIRELRVFKRKGTTKENKRKACREKTIARQAKRRLYIKEQIQLGNMRKEDLCHVFTQKKLPCDQGLPPYSPYVATRQLTTTGFDPFIFGRKCLLAKKQAIPKSVTKKRSQATGGFSQEGQEAVEFCLDQQQPQYHLVSEQQVPPHIEFTYETAINYAYKPPDSSVQWQSGSGYF